jgi:TRAP-type C4-dicarboxylate transport system permease small subunit
MGLLSNKQQVEYVGKRTKKQEIVGLIVCTMFVALFLWLTIESWNDFIDLEQNGKDLEVDTLTYVLYNIGGKWLATSIWVLLSGFFVFMGFKRWKGYNNADE